MALDSTNLHLGGKKYAPMQITMSISPISLRKWSDFILLQGTANWDPPSAFFAASLSTPPSRTAGRLSTSFATIEPNWRLILATKY